MEIPDTINSYLEPLMPAEAADKEQLPPNLPRQLDTVINHFENKRGNLVLFYGRTKAGNVAAAGLLGELMQHDIYRIDLAALVSKYLGETEKHLLQVFEFAAKNRFILFFDEADSLFGKHGRSRDGHERFANLDVDYLLRRIDAYPGMVILTTNARDSLDGRLLGAALWQINLNPPASPASSSWWRRLMNR